MSTYWPPRALTFRQLAAGLLGVMGLGLMAILVITFVIQQITDRLNRQLINERSRLVISEQLVNGIVNVELMFAELRLASSESAYQRQVHRINQLTTLLEQYLDLLEHGGTMQHTLALNVYGVDEMVRAVTYSPELRGAATYVIEVIEIAPLLEGIRAHSEHLSMLLRHRDACPQNATTCLSQVSADISLLGKELPSFFYRLGENANRNFYDGLRHLESIERDLDRQLHQLRLLQVGLFVLVGISAWGMAAFFVRRMDMAQKELQDARLKADAANVAKSRFLATMSHEIRTPMNGILGMAQILQMPNLDDKQRATYVNVLAQSGKSLLHIVNDILDLSRIESGHHSLHQQSTSPLEVGSDVIDLFRPQAQSKGLSLNFTYKLDMGERVMVDPDRLRQMISNLVNNALKFTHQGSIALEVALVGHTPPMLEFSVTDTGIGIPADKLDKLFEAFSQVDDSTTRQFGGSGLGLSIVRRLAEQMGGSVSVQSKAGHGSCFSFRVPVARVGTPDPHPTAESGQAPHNPASTLSTAKRFNAHVLIAEDNTINQMVLQRLLDVLGASWVLARDGQEAVDACTNACAFDLVFMDLQMPVMNGLDATRLIRTWEQNNGRQRRPIIACTASALNDSREACLAAGMDDVLVKPIEHARLTQILTKWLPAVVAEPSRQPGSHGMPKQADGRDVWHTLNRLLPMLAECMFDAVGVFDELKRQCTGTPLENGLGNIEQLLGRLDFSAAHQALAQWIETHGLEQPSPATAERPHADDSSP